MKCLNVQFDEPKEGSVAEPSEPCHKEALSPFATCADHTHPKLREEYGILQYFSYSHLPPTKAGVSKAFCDLALEMVMLLPRNPERTVALRKLLETQDAAVRCGFYKTLEQPR